MKKYIYTCTLVPCLIPMFVCVCMCLCVQLAEEHGVKFMETSAKSGLNVETVSSQL